MKQLVLCLCLIALTNNLSAQLKIWDGGGGTVDWGEGKNWNPDIAPIPGDSVIISGATVVLEGINPMIKSLLLLSNAELTIGPNSTITFTGSLSYALRADNSHVVNDGEIVIFDVGDNEFADRAIELLNGSTFTNNKICNIVETKGYGIRLESGSSCTNWGDITIHTEDRSAIAIVNLGSLFMNHGNMIITENGFFGTGISICGGKFINNSGINIEVDGAGREGISLGAGGHFINSGSISINASSGAQGIVPIWITSKIDLDGGIIDIQLTNANGVDLFSGTLTIKSGAELRVSGIPQDFLMDINSSAVLDCNGVLDLNN